MKSIRIKSIFALMIIIIIIFSGCRVNKTDFVVNDETASVEVNSAEHKAKLNDIGDLITEYDNKPSVACCINDSFSPYSASTRINRAVSSLIYDSLFITDNNFKPVECLADSIRISGSTATVTLKDAYFSDGTYVTADDVVYCFNKAKKSETKFSENLSTVKSAAAVSSYTVAFTSSFSDENVASLLDFPIFKSGSDTRKNSDNFPIPPKGSGKYRVNSKKTYLVRNKYYYGTKAKIKRIQLINTPDEDALLHNLEVGNITFYYSDLSSCELPKLRGNNKKVNTTNIVYLGANLNSYSALSYPQVRKYISASIDRKAIAEKAFYRNLVPSESIYNPKWYKSEKLTEKQKKKISLDVCRSKLKDSGYDLVKGNKYITNSAGDTMTISLIYYKGNEWKANAAKLIARQLKENGVNVETKGLSWDDYNYHLKSGIFDLFIGEVKLPSDMDVSSILKESGSAAYGIKYSKSTSKKKSRENVSGSTVRELNKYRSGASSVQKVNNAFINEMPIIPLGYRTGIFSYSAKIKNVSPSESDVFYKLK